MAAITDLATASSVASADYYVISQSGTDKKMAHSTLLANFISAGTWTPALAFSTSNGTASMTYTATYMAISDGTNRMIHLYMEAVITKGTASGNLQFTGMPVNANNITPFATMTINMDVGNGNFMYCNTSGALALVKSDSASGGNVAITAADMAATSYIRISGIYRYS